ncbi:hypothetical protein OXPF_40180 [Oxobacter pfennigii]|uniref:Uncharacterized protein n=1 Tax=Oxobacter pfennigii TaxID=36849 RepID=A0A0P8W3R7_9CLOT|nr:hypothetical protein [Oxobacter pfennigii]KPU42230.1 hypothetical protein OXPF_40140 [Oxobacter pfennigii]KPU42234.1 hypothetical protein OXPF_40180 [Oxobacter pfennigii]
MKTIRVPKFVKPIYSGKDKLNELIQKYIVIKISALTTTIKNKFKKA